MLSLVPQLHSTFNLAFHSPCTQLITALFAPWHTDTFGLAVVEVNTGHYFKNIMSGWAALHQRAVQERVCIVCGSSGPGRWQIEFPLQWKSSVASSVRRRCSLPSSHCCLFKQFAFGEVSQLLTCKLKPWLFCFADRKSHITDAICASLL